MAFLLTVLLIPESPRWLVKRGRREQAERVLARFGHEDPAREAAEIADSLHAETSGSHQRLFQRKYLKPLLLAFMIAAFNQLDGINAVIYYTADIFRMAGASKASALLQSVIIGLTNLVMTLVAMALIDRVGRKTLLLVGSVTFVFSHALAAWVFYTDAQGWIVIAAHDGHRRFSRLLARSRGLGLHQRNPAQRHPRLGLGRHLLHALGAVRGRSAGRSPSWPASPRPVPSCSLPLMMVLQFVLILKFLPETKGRSLEELQRYFDIRE